MTDLIYENTSATNNIDAPPKEQVPKKARPSEEEVQRLMQMSPQLDRHLAELLLSFTEEQLARFLEEETVDDDKK